MAQRQSITADVGTVKVVFTDRSDGDFAVASPALALAERRRAIIDRPWTWFRQVHGAEVRYVESPGQWAGTEADGAYTSTPGCPLTITTADCAPVVLVSQAGIAVVHAGWRGIVAGILSQAVKRMRCLDGQPIATLLGPCINPGAYEFGVDDLRVATERLGADVESRTSWGTPALDVPAAVAAACEAADWPPPTTPVACTSDENWFSHRTRADVGRQTTVAWIDADQAGCDTVEAGNAIDGS